MVRKLTLLEGAVGPTPGPTPSQQQGLQGGLRLWQAPGLQAVPSPATRLPNASSPNSACFTLPLGKNVQSSFSTCHSALPCSARLTDASVLPVLSEWPQKRMFQSGSSPWLHSFRPLIFPIGRNLFFLIWPSQYVAWSIPWTILEISEAPLGNSCCSSLLRLSAGWGGGVGLHLALW